MNAVKKIFKRWKKNFHRLSGEKKISPLPAERGEKKIHRLKH